METKELSELKELFNSFCEKNKSIEDFNIRQNGSDIWIEVGAMYRAPLILSLPNLIRLGKFFDTEDIVFESFSRSGCDTCDHGSSYGYDITISNSKVQVIDNGKKVKDLR